MASAKQDYAAVPPPNDALVSKGYGAGTDMSDLANTPAHPIDSSPLSQSMQRQNSVLGRFDDLSDDRGSTVQQLEGAGLHRTASTASTPGYGASQTPARSNTLKKKSSVGGGLARRGSLKRTNSRRSVHAGSIKGVAVTDEAAKISDENSVFYTPVPTSGAPTEILANRFQGTSHS